MVNPVQLGSGFQRTGIGQDFENGNTQLGPKTGPAARPVTRRCSPSQRAFYIDVFKVVAFLPLPLTRFLKGASRPSSPYPQRLAPTPELPEARQGPLTDECFVPALSMMSWMCALIAQPHIVFRKGAARPSTGVALRAREH